MVPRANLLSDTQRDWTRPACHGLQQEPLLRLPRRQVELGHEAPRTVSHEDETGRVGHVVQEGRGVTPDLRTLVVPGQGSEGQPGGVSSGGTCEVDSSTRGQDRGLGVVEDSDGGQRKEGSYNARNINVKCNLS